MWLQNRERPESLFFIFGQRFIAKLFPRDAASGIFQRVFSAAVEFGNLFGRECVGKIIFGKITNLLEGQASLLKWELAELFDNLGRTHGGNLLL